LKVLCAAPPLCVKPNILRHKQSVNPEVHSVPISLKIAMHRRVVAAAALLALLVLASSPTSSDAAQKSKRRRPAAEQDYNSKRTSCGSNQDVMKPCLHEEIDPENCIMK
jgi:hypothetical protein